MFAKTIDQYSQTLEALREFVALIGPFLTEEVTKQIKADAAVLSPLAVAFSYLEEEKGQKERIEKIAAALLPKVEVIEEKGADKDKGSVTLKFKDGALGRSFDMAMKRLFTRMGHRSYLYRSGLISLISTVEWYLSSLIHAYYEKHPDAIGGKDKQISLNDLKGLGSIPDAIKFLVEGKVEDVLRGSFDDWVGFLRDTLKLSMGYLESDRHRLVECCQRRNVLVHNNGVVNTIYLSKVHEPLRKGLKVGSQIQIDEDYVDEAIRLFERAFVLIGAELWKKLAPKDEERGDCLVKLGYEHLKRERWDVAEGIYLFLVQDKSLKEALRLLAQVNYWQCLKWQSRFGECKSDIEGTDFSAKEKRFQLARLALIDDEKGFFALLPGLLKVKAVSYDDLFEWPLFRGMRETKVFKRKYGRKFAAFRLSVDRKDSIDNPIPTKASKKHNVGSTDSELEPVAKAIGRIKSARRMH